MVQTAVEKLPEFIDLGLDIIVAIATGLIKAAPELILKIPSLVMQVVDKFIELGPELFEAGKQMFTELWDGLGAIWDDIYNWVSDKVEWLTDKLFFWRKEQEEMGGDSPDGSHASGLPYVPYDGYKAVLHRGETVVNANDTAGMLDAIKSMADSFAANASRGNGGEFVLNINGKEFYRASLDDLRAVEKANPEVATA